MKVLIISNGNGEDLIGNVLATRMRLMVPDVSITVMPLVGEGNHYKGEDLTIIGPRREMPSGGFLTSPKAIIRDIASGMLLHHFQQVCILLLHRNRYDRVVCVGDVFCLLMGNICSKSSRIHFLPTAKSDYIERHYPIEKKIIRKRARCAYPRDNRTAASFDNYGINCRFFGNVMMDALQTEGIHFPVSDDEVAIGVLPGSRKEAYKNFQMILDVLIYLYQDIRKSGLEARFFIAVPQSLNRQTLEEMIAVEGGVLNTRRFTLTEKFADLLHTCHFVVGMAGTANEQAAGLGKPVFTWEGRGPQTCSARIEAQKKLLGDSLIVLEGTAAQKARKLWKLAQSQDLYSRCVLNARQRMGLPGAAEKIVANIMEST